MNPSTETPNEDLRIPNWARPLSGLLALAGALALARGALDGQFTAWNPVLAFITVAMLVAWTWLFGQVALKATYPKWFKAAYRRLDCATKSTRSLRAK
jgi:hypothetical protein